VALGNRLHLGERTGVVPRQEDRGYFPSVEDTYSRSWRLGNTANLCIGQDKIAVTPLQIAVMMSAVANGGNIFYPRLVSSVTPYGDDQPSQTFPAGRVRDTLGVSQRTLRIVHEAMVADVEGPEGTGREAAVPGFNIAGKTGTAEVEKNNHNEKSAQITWFGSFGPVENPRYAVVIMVVSGASGGLTCAPLGHDVYLAIQQKEQNAALRRGALAEIQK
jgi:penicillin-binding protein 2